jgi:MarR family transcriptional regulator, organic hydroperoxide resistance regulator
MKKRPLPADAHTAAEILFGYELRETSRLLLNALKQEIEPHGITLTQYFLLRHLWDEEGINQSELSERLATTQPATVATVDSLEKRGLIKRVRGTDDRRVVRIFLTAKGRTMRTTLLRYAYDISVDALDGMSAGDVARLRAALAAVRANLELQFGEDAEGRGA